MKLLTSLNRLRRPAVGAFIVLTLASSAVGWTAGTVAASSGPQASLVGGAATDAAHHELGTVSNDGTNTPSGDQGAAGPTDTTPGSSNAGPGTNAGPAAGSDTGPVNDGPVTDPSKPDLLVPDVDYGDANTPSSDQGADCSTVTYPGSTDASSGDQGTVCSTDTTPGSTDASPGTDRGANADPGTPEPYQLVPDVDYSGTTTPSGDQDTAGSTDTTPGSTDAGTDAVGL